MENISRRINHQTGLEFSHSGQLILRTGRKVQRAQLKLGAVNLEVLLVEVPESFDLKNEIKDLIQLAQYERVVIYSSHLLEEDTKMLKEYKIGYVDDYGHYFIPLEIVSEGSYSPRHPRKSERLTSVLNEFSIGFLFFKNDGLLETTQEQVGKFIGKSAATVNLVLKAMEREKLVVKIAEGYHLANIENYFERWRFIFSQYKGKKQFSRYKTKLSDSVLKTLLKDKQLEEKWALSGPRVESLLEDGYLENTDDFSIFVEKQFQKNVMQTLKLIPQSNGEIVLIPTLIDLRGEGQIAHEIVICAELMQSNNARIKEAGQRRWEKYLARAKEVMIERFGRKNF